jgi:NAD-dependent SIR2 family protein deacetylase
MNEFQRAADAIRDADALLITAGAGMGVDSGLPDFRGTDGFWRAYPAVAKLGLRFEELATPDWFETDPRLAWGFYGHRLMLYRTTKPHGGFEVLRRWACKKPRGYFVFTSNVDGQFQRAGFDEQWLVECHGSIHHLQCTRPCCGEIRSAEGIAVTVDEATLNAAEPLPTCEHCGDVARPNVLMFGDGGWIGSRTMAQYARFERWLKDLGDGAKLAIVECGAGSAVPTVRTQSERVARRDGATLIRLNPREPNTPNGHIGIAQSARAALEAIDAVIAR